MVRISGKLSRFADPLRTAQRRLRQVLEREHSGWLHRDDSGLDDCLTMFATGSSPALPGSNANLRSTDSCHSPGEICLLTLSRQVTFISTLKSGLHLHDRWPDLSLVESRPEMFAVIAVLLAMSLSERLFQLPEISLHAYPMPDLLALFLFDTAELDVQLDSIKDL